jgi:N6-adenosine-specific RNA methylase IME4
MKPFPDKKYQIIYADPPWKYQDQSCEGAAAAHYDGMSLDSICTLPVADISDKDCVLFLWATYPMLKEALRVIDAWGFEYKSIAFQWLKLNKNNQTPYRPFYGLGRWTRGNTEPCFLATKGKPSRVSDDVSQLIKRSLTKHSEKPHEAREKIVRLMGDLPRIELFARRKFPGWDCWGDDVELDGPVLTTDLSLF